MQSAENITVRSASTAPCCRATLRHPASKGTDPGTRDRSWHQQINWRALRATLRPLSTTRNNNVSVSVGAILTSEQIPTMQPFDSDQNWQIAMGSMKSDWAGYCGAWARFSAEGDAKVLGEYYGLRTFRDLGNEKYEHVNVYTIDMGGCETRDVDANFMMTWSYNKERDNTPEGWCHPIQKSEGPFRGRVLAPSPGRLITVTFALPLEELREGVEAVRPLFASEFFLRQPGEKLAWSGSPMFSTETGKPWGIYFIREQTTDANPHDAVDYEALGVPSARPPIGPSPADWLEGTWTGKVELIRWEADGRMQHVLESTVEDFELPRTDSEYILSRLPDSVYFSYPAQLPLKAADMPPEGITLQMGGFVALDGSIFRREMSHYGRDGRIEYVRFEEWNKH